MKVSFQLVHMHLVHLFSFLVLPSNCIGPPLMVVWLQIQLDGSDWSFPFAIENEETMHIIVRHKNGARQAVRVNVRGHEDGSRYLAIFQLGSLSGPYRYIYVIVGLCYPLVCFITSF